MDIRRARRTHRTGALLGALPSLIAVMAVMACTPGPDSGNTTTSAPSGSVAAVCAAMPSGPAQAPANAVPVDPAVEGDLSTKTSESPPGTTFWIQPGTHTLGSDEYSQVVPKDGDVYLGAPGAVLDGHGFNRYAFTQQAQNVVIRYLTIQGFNAPADQGVVNHDSGNGWVIEYNTIQKNGGAALMAGARQQVRHNCLRDNGQYGMNAAQPGGTIVGLVVEDNEISGNNTDDWERRAPGCGCTGGIKFWGVNGADVRDNWIHHNHGPALWADTNNNDFLIEDNLIEDNDSTAIFYETSYNAVIRNNMIRRNNWISGREFVDRGDNFPVATIYLSESGGEPRIQARTDRIEIYGNVMEDNWSGITLWENADRFCNSPANTSTAICTLLVKNVTQCSQPGIATEPLRGDCRWKTQHVDIHHNRFAFNPQAIGCLSFCGRMAVISNFGSVPEWSPYKGESVQQAITFDQDNRWHDNTYTGPWTFMAHDTGKNCYLAQWQSLPYRQDQDSTYSGR